MENILRRTGAAIFQTGTAARTAAKEKEQDFSRIIEKIEFIKNKLREEDEFFNSTDDDDLTESSIYRTMSLECEYRYWLRTARRNGVVFSHRHILQRQKG